jgi:alpha/beta superfamily hydrolase
MHHKLRECLVVLRGQYLERPALVEVGGIILEALYHRGERRPALLICPPLGELGGMDAPPLAELAWACAMAGFPSLRFQHRGWGASQGTSDPAAAQTDAVAALEHLRLTTQSPRVALAGYAAGCATALALAARPQAGPVVLICPPTASVAGAPPEVLARTLALLAESMPAAERGRVEAPLRAAGGAAEVIPGSDPLFRVGLPLVGKRAVQWIGR